MTKRTTILLPKAQKSLSEVGENIKLARLRRKFSSEQVAERANISRPTLVAIENGSPNVSVGSYLKVLFVLGLENDFFNIGKDDILGRRLQDAGLTVKKRAPKKEINKKTDENIR
jgi:transcriptional regulator with XRE-family HTH domain